jgi:hypothetical protein
MAREQKPMTRSRRLCVLFFALIAGQPLGAALGQAADAREDEIFGAPDVIPSPRANPADEMDTALFPESAGTSTASEKAPEGLLNESLAAAEDFLAIGGFLWTRLQYSHVAGRSFGESPLQSPNFSDLYLDARPNDRVRAYVRGRLRYDPTVVEGTIGISGQPTSKTAVQLDQLWLKFDIAHHVFVTVGKERVKWATGRFWNPNDLLNTQILDPLSGVVLFDERLGVPLVDLHVPVESLGWNFHAVATIDDAFQVDQLGAAFLGEFLVGQTELSLLAGFRKDQPVRLGAMVSSGIWLFDLRGEVAVTKNVTTPAVSGTCNPSGFVEGINNGSILPPTGDFDPNQYPEYFGTPVDRSGEWIPQVVAGAEIGLRYSDQDSVFLGGEYFYNDAGYSSSDPYSCLIVRSSFQPFYLGRHYAALYAYLPSPGGWNNSNFTLSFISNLSDLSAILRLDYRVQILTYLDVNAFAQGHLGNPGDEFTFTFESAPLELPGGIPPDAVIDDPRLLALGSGLSISQPVVELGIGLRLSY